MKEVVKIFDLEKRIRGGKDINFEDVLIELPNGLVLTFEEYVDKGYNIRYSSTYPVKSHITSPLLKERKKVPKGMGSEKKKK